MNKRKFILIMVAIAVSLTGCMTKKEETVQESTTTSQPSVSIEQQEDINVTPIIEDETVYSYDDPTSIVCFYITVRRGITGTETDHTLDEVNNVVKFADEEHVDNEVLAEALVQVGDETGPLNQMFGYSEVDSNATIESRGNSTSKEVQKSYTLKFMDNAGLWRNQKKIALVKSVYDSTRFRNKLYFDLLKDVPDVPSLRTQFVRVFIKDETAGKESFTDYGLFTQIETPNKRYLSNHGLDNSGYLYKARSFNFELSAPIKNFDDPDFNLEQFETVLSCSGSEDNERLIEMITAVNDPARNINEVFDKYFDRDNYLTWLAYNILMGNVDTTMQNFYLYSPLNGEKWYFIPWDGDASLFNYEFSVKSNSDVSAWEKGISNYWGVILHQKFLSNESNRAQLTEKIEMLKNEYLTEENVTGLVSQYDETIKPYAVNMPDLLYQTVKMDQREDIISKIYNEIENNYNGYYDTIKGLMPFFLDETNVDGNNVHFTWGESYDMQGKLVNYKFLLSTTLDFSNIVYEEDNITDFSVDVSDLKAGQYYWKVIATSDDGRIATPFNHVYLDDEYYDGLESLVIE